jgi:peptidoglycan-associated lipoprotein
MKKEDVMTLSRLHSHRLFRWNTFALAAGLAMLTTAGCHKKTTDTQPTANETAPTMAPPTASITADPLAIDLGQSVVLNWRTSNATSVKIDGIGDVPSNGTQTVSPSNSTNFHLVATNTGGTTEASVRVTVRIPQVPTAPTGDDSGNMGSEAEFKAHVKDIFFDYDSYELRPDAQASVAATAAYLNSHPSIKLLIGGYCDDRGSAEYNITLGENRANSAKTALVSAGIAASRVRVVSYGKERQFCTEEDEACWQQNRRGQFTIDR